MPPTTATEAVIEAVDKREDVLGLLIEGVSEKRGLVERLDHSRSTVDRAVRELAEHGLVSRTAEGYRPTLLGRCLFGLRRGFVETAEELVGAGEALASTAESELLTAELLSGAEIHAVDDVAPFRTHSRVERLLDDARAVRAAITAVEAPGQFRRLHELVVERGAELELLVTPGLLDRLCAEFETELSAMAERDGFSLHVGDSHPSCFQVVERDGCRLAVVTVRDGTGRVRGLVVNDAVGAVEECLRRLERYLADATDVTRGLRSPEMSPEEVCASD